MAQWETDSAGIHYNDGNVGIGTANPASRKLVIGNGAMILDGNSSTFPTFYVDADMGEDVWRSIARISASNSGNWATPFLDVEGYRSTTKSKRRIGLQVKDGSGSNDGYHVRDLLLQRQGGDLGVGTATPERPIHVAGKNQSAQVALERTASSRGQYDFGVDAAGLKFWAGGYASDSTPDIIFQQSGDVGIGTTAPSKKLSVNGYVRAKEVLVEADGWSDYVFEEGYDLPSLTEVQSFIQREGHLPAVPSTESVEKNGLRLGEMDATLLRKVEELTLYAIEQKKRADSLSSKVRQLRSRDEAQQKQIDALKRQNKLMRKRLKHLEKHLETSSEHR